MWFLYIYKLGLCRCKGVADLEPNAEICCDLAGDNYSSSFLTLWMNTSILKLLHWTIWQLSEKASVKPNLIYFLWGALKDIVCHNNSLTCNELEEAIYEACVQIYGDTLDTTESHWQFHSSFPTRMLWERCTFWIAFVNSMWACTLCTAYLW